MGEANAQVRALLAERDIPCPGCECNLRGLAGNKCPECGRSRVMPELMGEMWVRLGGWFWGGAAIDAGLIVWMAVRLAKTKTPSNAAGMIALSLVLSAAFTSIFVLLVYFRREFVDAKAFESEMA